MEIRQLQNHLRMLIELDETESPILSCFLDLGDPDGETLLREMALVSRKALDPAQRPAFDRALERVHDHLPWELDETTRSAAIFARAGVEPLFQVLEFQAELPTRLFVESTPVLFPLVELKDNYHRYVLMICGEESARILEVSLGSVTRELWTRRPELRKRVGREWTQRHYQNHRRDRSDRFLKEKIALLQKIAGQGGHTHLMLAGDPRIVARVRRALPKGLESRLVDVVPASSRDRTADVVEATLSTFLEHEERESQAAVELLRQELRRGGLAVSGYRDCREALRSGQADLLLLASDERGEKLARREELIRLASATGVQIEVVEHSDTLEELGGVGCLLRYSNSPVREAIQAA